MLRNSLGYKDAGINRHRQLVRLAALLHDVGHAPFSHAGEDLMPHFAKQNRLYKHEDYSTAIIRSEFRDVIEGHQTNISNYNFKADEIADLIEGKATASGAALWQDIVVRCSQLDADRMDYLLRDSHHAGVEVRQVRIAPCPRRIAVEKRTDTVGSLRLAHPRSLFRPQGQALYGRGRGFTAEALFCVGTTTDQVRSFTL